MYSTASFPAAEFPDSSQPSSYNINNNPALYPHSNNNAELNYYAAPPSTYQPDLYSSGNSNSNSSSSSHASSGIKDNSSLFSGPIASSSSSHSSSSPLSYDDEPPLLEELGINPHEIWTRTLSVCLPFSSLPAIHENDCDLAGPFVFCLALGSFLLLHGKIHFGYIYGFGVTSCLLMYFIVNLMSDEAISVERTTSILGYALVPLVLLAFLVIFIDSRSMLGAVLAITVILWCTVNATRLFEAALQMREQRYLLAYPVAIIYACFALLTIF